MKNSSDQSITKTTSDFSSAQKINILKQMVRIRCFEQVCLKRYQVGEMGGFLNLDIGQESIPVVARSLMGPDDHCLTGHRCLGHLIASGTSMESALAELMGKTSGCNKGKGGMQSMSHPSAHFWGGYSVAGSQTPVGAGLAFALKYRKTAGAVLCFLGDGAVNQGVFHESLNLAGLFDLPVVYIIENNGYAMGTSTKRGSAGSSLARRAEGYNIEWDIAEGWDIYPLREKLHVAMERARQESRPTVIEVQTYRFFGHTVADAWAKKYRTPEEIEFHKAERDPIRLWKKQLEQEGVIFAEHYWPVFTNKWAIEEAWLAAGAARSAVPPTFEDITKDVYWEVDHDTESGRSGRHFFND